MVKSRKARKSIPFSLFYTGGLWGWLCSLRDSCASEWCGVANSMSVICIYFIFYLILTFFGLRRCPRYPHGCLIGWPETRVAKGWRCCKSPGTSRSVGRTYVRVRRTWSCAQWNTVKEHLYLESWLRHWKSCSKNASAFCLCVTRKRPWSSHMQGKTTFWICLRARLWKLGGGRRYSS